MRHHAHYVFVLVADACNSVSRAVYGLAVSEDDLVFALQLLEGLFINIVPPLAVCDRDWISAFSLNWFVNGSCCFVQSCLSTYT